MLFQEGSAFFKRVVPFSEGSDFFRRIVHFSGGQCEGSTFFRG